MTNPIIAEVRAARAALAAKHGYDIHRITEWARAETEARKAALKKSKPKRSSVPTKVAPKISMKKKRPSRSTRT